MPLETPYTVFAKLPQGQKTNEQRDCLFPSPVWCVWLPIVGSAEYFYSLQKVQAGEIDVWTRKRLEKTAGEKMFKR